MFTGTQDLWPYLLLLNAIPALLSLVVLPFLPDSPRYLMLVKNRRLKAEKGIVEPRNITLFSVVLILFCWSILNGSLK
jgi:hypothetical protein